MRALTLLMLVPTLATAQIADPGEALMRGYAVWLGGFYEAGDTELADYGDGLQPKSIGLRYYERQGVITGLLMGILTAGSAGVAAASPKSVKTERKGNWKITTTTHRSEAEKAQIRKDGTERASRLASASNQSFELELYMNSLGSDASGYRMTGFFGFPIGDSMMLDVGIGGAEVDSAFEHEGKLVRLSYISLGMPLRLNYALGPVLLWGQWDWNWAGHGDTEEDIDTEELIVRDLRPFPVRAGLTANLFGRLFFEGIATTPSLTSGKFGFRGSAGMRF